MTLFPFAQLSRQLAHHEINAGVQIFASFLGANHRAVCKHSHLCGLLGDPWVPRHRQVNIGFADGITEMGRGPFQFCVGVLPQRRSDLEVATMDQHLHPLFLCRWISAS